MAATSLVFNQPSNSMGNPVPLVLGADEIAPQKKYTLAATGRITLGLRGTVRVATVQRVAAVGQITACMRGTVAVGWNVNVSRPSVAMATDASQQAQPLRADVKGVWQQSQRTQSAVAQIWQDAQHVSQQVRSLWQQAQPLRGIAQDTQELAARDAGTFAVAQAITTNYQGALNEAIQEQARLAGAAAVATRNAGRLREQLSEADKRIATASAAAVREYAATANKLLGQCSQRYTEVAAKADGHALDARTCRAAWPVRLVKQQIN